MESQCKGCGRELGDSPDCSYCKSYAEAKTLGEF